MSEIYPAKKQDIFIPKAAAIKCVFCAAGNGGVAALKEGKLGSLNSTLSIEWSPIAQLDFNEIQWQEIMSGTGTWKFIFMECSTLSRY